MPISYKSLLKQTLLPAALLIGTATGCTGSSGNSPGSTPSTSSIERGQAAARACDGLLGVAGGSNLQDLLQAKRFIDAEDIEIEDAQETAKALSNESASSGINHAMCAIQDSDKAVGKTLTVSARWQRLKPGDLEWVTRDQRTVFDLANSGQQTYATPYASTSDATALIHFRCPVGVGKQHDMVASLTAETELVPRSDQQNRREQLTRIANAAAVQLAKEMSCLAESKLPTSLGKLTVA